MQVNMYNVRKNAGQQEHLLAGTLLEIMQVSINILRNNAGQQEHC